MYYRMLRSNEIGRYRILANLREQFGVKKQVARRIAERASDAAPTPDPSVSGRKRRGTPRDEMAVVEKPRSRIRAVRS